MGTMVAPRHSQIDFSSHCVVTESLKSSLSDSNKKKNVGRVKNTEGLPWSPKGSKSQRRKVDLLLLNSTLVPNVYSPRLCTKFKPQEGQRIIKPETNERKL